jgi:Fe2+ or Zn2+ uptake regulation protein
MALQGKQLRAAILLLLDERHRADSSRTVEDTDMAQALNAPIEEIRRQLDILAEQGYTNEANTFGGHSAYIAPKGMAMADELREAAAQGAPDRPIGFK